MERRAHLGVHGRVGWIPGTHTVVGLDGEDLGWDGTFVIEAWGRQAGFDSTQLTGRAWEIDPWIFAGFARDGVFLQVGEVAGDEVAFRVLVDTGQQTCGLHQGVAQVDDRGMFQYAEADVVAGSEPPMVFESLSLLGGFDADAATMGGVTLAFTADTWDMAVAIDREDDPQSICALAEQLGFPCRRGDGGLLTVLDYLGTGAEAIEVDAASLPPGDVPGCFVEGTEAWDFSCSVLGSLSIAGGPVILLVAGLIGARRRRADPEGPGGRGSPV